MADSPETEEAADLGPARSEPITAPAMGDLHLLTTTVPGARFNRQRVSLLSLQVA